jgi:hypothetical protein
MLATVAVSFSGAADVVLGVALVVALGAAVEVELATGGRGVLNAQIASCILTACPGVKWVMHESKE